MSQVPTRKRSAFVPFYPQPPARAEMPLQVGVLYKGDPVPVQCAIGAPAYALMTNTQGQTWVKAGYAHEKDVQAMVIRVQKLEWVDKIVLVTSGVTRTTIWERPSLRANDPYGHGGAMEVRG